MQEKMKLESHPPIRFSVFRSSYKAMSQELCLCRSLFIWNLCDSRSQGPSMALYLWPKPAFSVPSQPTLPPSCPCPRPSSVCLGGHILKFPQAPFVIQSRFSSHLKGVVLGMAMRPLFQRLLCSRCVPSALAVWGPGLWWPSPEWGSQSKQLTHTAWVFKNWFTSVSGFKLLCLLCFFFPNILKQFMSTSRGLACVACVCLPRLLLCPCIQLPEYLQKRLNSVTPTWICSRREMTLLEGINSCWNLGAGMVYFPLRTAEEYDLLSSWIDCYLVF